MRPKLSKQHHSKLCVLALFFVANCFSNVSYKNSDIREDKKPYSEKEYLNFYQTVLHTQPDTEPCTCLKAVSSSENPVFINQNSTTMKLAQMIEYKNLQNTQNDLVEYLV